MKALVYICALAPAEGETSQAEQDKHPKTAVFDHIEVVDGRVWLKPSGTKEFCGDLSAADQKLVFATHGAPLADLFTQPVRGEAWSKKPTFYVLGTNDHTVHPDLQHFVAKRMNAKVTELPSSHVPMLSQPQRVYEVIKEAAEVASRGPEQVQQQPSPALA